MGDKLRDKWAQVQEELQRRLAPQQYRTWFACVRGEFADSDGELTLTVPNEFYREWIGRNYLQLLREAVAAVQPGAGEVRLRVDPALAPAEAPELPEKQGPGMPLNPHFTFEEFVVGPTNRLAHAAARAVADAPGTVYNPLYVHGAVGLGKSHLLQAICHALRQRQPPLRVLYLSCEMFVNDFISAIQHGRLDSFRARCRNADALVIDDIQFLARAERTQEEFFHTFNALHNAQKQVVLSSDSEPQGIAIEPRLTSRFASGLVVGIDPPCLETRMAILRRKAQLRGVALPDEVVTYIAETYTDNVRELEGALVKLAGIASLCKQAITMALAREVLTAPGRPARTVTMQDILTTVANHFRTKVADILSRKRSRSVAYPRQICLYLSRTLTNHSLQEIGAYFGGRDHSTVIHAEAKIREEAERRPATRELLARLRAEIVREK